MSRSRALVDLESNLTFYKNEWRIQRIGWVLVALLLVLALAGLFGNGPLSRAHADGAAGRIEYERFTRYGLSTALVVTPAGTAQGVDRIGISAAYLETLEVESITPEPAAVKMSGHSIVYEFASAAPGASIAFHVHPQRLWRHTAEVTINGGAPLAISQLTYP